MTKEEFNDVSKVTQVRRTNLPNQQVRNVLCINHGEGLIQIDEPTWKAGPNGNEVWIRYENLSIITKRQ